MYVHYVLSCWCICIFIRQAAKTYNVPKSTIGDRLTGRFDMDVPSVHGRPPAIPKDIDLLKRLERQPTWG